MFFTVVNVVFEGASLQLPNLYKQFATLLKQEIHEVKKTLYTWITQTRLIRCVAAETVT